MFSGIVESTSLAKTIVSEGESMRIYFPAPLGWKLKTGESLSIDGICSTIESLKGKVFSVFYMPETLSKTNLAQADETHLFNFERSLTLQSLIGGHLVSGHIDTTACVSSITTQQESKVIQFQIDPQFTKYIIYKGSIAVNGVSLTVVSVTFNLFTVSLIPYTLSHTNLGELAVSDIVNIEVDMISKYLEKLQPK